MVAVVLAPDCEFGFGLPNGSPELPSFSNEKVEEPFDGGCEFGFGLPNGSPEPPSFPNGSFEPPSSPQIRLTRSHTSDKSSVTVSRDSDTSRGRWVAAASGPAMRRSMRRRDATRRRGKIMRCSFPGGQGRLPPRRPDFRPPIQGAQKDGQLIRQKVQSADQRGQVAGRRAAMALAERAAATDEVPFDLHRI